MNEHRAFDFTICEKKIVIMDSILTWLSFRIYRKTWIRGLLFLSIGLIFLTAGYGIEGLLFKILHFELLFSTLVETILVAIGFLSFIYAVYGNIDKQRMA